MAKYRVTNVQFCVKKRTHCVEFNMTVTAINTDDESDIVTFTEETSASTCSVLAQIYMRDYWTDDLKYFMGEHIDVPTPYGDVVQVFALYGEDESGNKVYRPGYHPIELMHKYVADNPDKYHSMQPV